MMKPDPDRYAVARWLFAATAGSEDRPVTLVIDLRDGHEYVLEPAPSQAMRAIQATGSPPPGTEAAVRELLAAGWVVPWADKTAASAGACTRPVTTQQAPWTLAPGEITASDRLWALAGVVIACTTSLVPAPHQIRYTLATARLAALAAHRVASPDELQRLLEAVYTVSRWWPLRFACDERAHALVIAAGLRRRRAALRIGVALAPPRRHAWGEANGVPVVRPGELQVTGVFTPMRRGDGGPRRPITGG